MGFFDKIKAGLTKTRDALSDTLGSVFSGFSEIADDFYDELEESLILADLGVDPAVKATPRHPPPPARPPPPRSPRAPRARPGGGGRSPANLGGPFRRHAGASARRSRPCLRCL